MSRVAHREGQITTITRRIEWNGSNNILVLDNGRHGAIETTLDEFVELATDLKTGLHLRTG
jgi:hypothetical protein